LKYPASVRGGPWWSVSVRVIRGFFEFGIVGKYPKNGKAKTLFRAL
jgi:hypothetical protein